MNFKFQNYLEQFNPFLQETIIKEILHYEILDSLFSINDIQKSLVFQGGTALRLCYNNDRYSEDLDFVMSKNQPFSREFMVFFEKIFKEKILKKYDLNAEIDGNNVNNGIIQRWTAKVFVPIFGRKSRINIEVANITSHDHHSMSLQNNHSQIFNMNIFAEVETLDEILADKILALSQRAYIKFRDLWDIEWLTRQKRLEPNFDLIKLKIEDYHCDDFVLGLKNRKIEISQANTEQGFLREMTRFLDEDYFEKVKQFGYFDTIRQSIERIIDETILQMQTQNKPKIRKM